MPEDVSLDAFASSAEDDEDDVEKDDVGGTKENDGTEATVESDVETTDDDDANADDADPEQSAVEPAVSTYAWSPEGATCADCGESVEERWRAEGQRDGDLVCADCKRW